MPSRLLMLAFLLLLLAAPAAQARSSARAVMTECDRSLEEVERAGVFEAQMRSVPGTSRMQMRFTLQARTPERDRWRSVDAPGFGEWVGSEPGTSRYVYTKRVENLLAPASYRVTVRFRWLDADGGVIERARDRSRTCRQPDPRADLEVRSLGVQAAADPSRSRYVAYVRNTGRSLAEASALTITVDGVELPPVTVLALEPDGDALVSVEGPACEAGAPIEADADAEESVDERDEENRFTRDCPSA